MGLKGRGRASPRGAPYTARSSGSLPFLRKQCNGNLRVALEQTVHLDGMFWRGSLCIFTISEAISEAKKQAPNPVCT